MKLRDKRTFLAAIIIGLASHMYRLANYMINNDGANYLDTISPSWVTSMGRYLLPVVEKVRGPHELTWLIGLMSIIWMSLASVLIVNMFDIRSTVGQVVVAWIVVANPVVTSIFSYMYTADGYFFGMFLAVVCAYLAITGKGVKSAVFSVLALYIALGFYQAFLTTAIMLMIIDLILLFLDSSRKTKDVWKQVCRCFAIGVVSVVAYLITVKIVWKVGGYGVTDYMGVGKEQSAGIGKYVTALKDCYIDFARVFLVRWEWTYYNVMNLIVFALIAILTVVLITKNKMWNKPYRWIVVLLIFMALPIATHIFEFISEDLSYTSTSMEYGTMMVFLLPVVLWNRLEFGKGIFAEWKELTYIKKHAGYVLSMLLMLCIAFNFTVIANKAYYNIYMANESEKLLYNRVLARMEQTEGYMRGMPVMIVGSAYQMPEYVTHAPMMSGVVDKHFLSSETEIINYMSKISSTPIGFQSFEREKEIAQTSEFKSMGMWPEASSVRIIDDTMVIILSYTDIDKLYE